MPNQPPQPTILVKKADGTSVRMSMDEFQNYRQGTRNKEQGTKQPQSHAAPQQQAKKPATPAPAPSLARENKVQLKEENRKIPTDERVKQIMVRIPFTVGENVRGRLQSLLQSRVKDVRTDDQVVEYLKRPEDQGGIGLDAEQMNQVMAILRAVLGAQPQPSRLRQSAPALSPVAKFVSAYASSSRLPSSPSAPTTAVSVPRVLAVSAVSPKPMMHDVIAPSAPVVEKKILGPIDELRGFTLVDFRRLGGTAPEAGVKLLAKFTTLHAESFVLFLDASQAWKESPLYREYQQMIVAALNERKSVRALTGAARSGSEGKMTMEEVEAIVGVNKELT